MDSITKEENKKVEITKEEKQFLDLLADIFVKDILKKAEQAYSDKRRIIRNENLK